MSGNRTLLAHKPYQKLFLDLSSSTISTSAYTQIMTAASNTKGCTAIEIFYSGPAVLYLATGASSSESNLPFYIFPGGTQGLVPMEISSGVRLSVKAVDQAVTSGVLVINFYG